MSLTEQLSPASEEVNSDKELIVEKDLGSLVLAWCPHVAVELDSFSIVLACTRYVHVLVADVVIAEMLKLLLQ